MSAHGKTPFNYHEWKNQLEDRKRQRRQKRKDRAWVQKKHSKPVQKRARRDEQPLPTPPPRPPVVLIHTPPNTDMTHVVEYTKYPDIDFPSHRPPAPLDRVETAFRSAENAEEFKQSQENHHLLGYLRFKVQKSRKYERYLQCDDDGAFDLDDDAVDLADDLTELQRAKLIRRAAKGKHAPYTWKIVIKELEFQDPASSDMSESAEEEELAEEEQGMEPESEPDSIKEDELYRRNSSSSSSSSSQSFHDDDSSSMEVEHRPKKKGKGKGKVKERAEHPDEVIWSNNNSSNDDEEEGSDSESFGLDRSSPSPSSLVSSVSDEDSTPPPPPPPTPMPHQESQSSTTVMPGYDNHPEKK